MSDPYEKALYSPETGRIASPALQCLIGGSMRLPMAFDSADWMRLPDETLVPMEERLSVWEGLAAMTRAERVALAEQRGVRTRAGDMIGDIWTPIIEGTT